MNDLLRNKRFCLAAWDRHQAQACRVVQIGGAGEGAGMRDCAALWMMGGQHVPLRPLWAPLIWLAGDADLGVLRMTILWLTDCGLSQC